jgi:hypothetical protein
MKISPKILDYEVVATTRPEIDFSATLSDTDALLFKLNFLDWRWGPN